MVDIRAIIYTQKFERDVRKVKDSSLKEKLEKQIRKIVDYPETGKPLRYGPKGELTIYVKPYRLIYAVQRDNLILLRFEQMERSLR